MLVQCMPLFNQNNPIFVAHIMNGYNVIVIYCYSPDAVIAFEFTCSSEV